MSNIKNFENSTVLESPKIIEDLICTMPEYKGMLQTFHASLPEIKKSTDNFNKTQSQFMDNMLTLSHQTPLRNVRQILAEIKKTELALKEAYIQAHRKEIEIEIKKRDLLKEDDNLKQKLIQLDMLELHKDLESIKSSIGGAIRKITNATEKYNEILDNKNLRNFTEEDFEKEEEKYHIMRAFDQAVTAARSRSGVVDEGNMIYFTQIGINAGTAQKCIFDYLTSEGILISQNKEPTHEMYIDFLEKMAKKFENCSNNYSVKKGLISPISNKALLK